MFRHHTVGPFTRLWPLMLVVPLAVAIAPLNSEGKDPQQVPQIDAKALATMVQNFEKVEKIEFSWGWIRWMMNSKLDPNAQMTLGIVQINAGQTNPLHIHPNCEEHLYVLSGSCEHRLGKETVVLKTGDVIRIPRSVPHMARTFDKESMRAIIVYSSGDRQFVIVDEKGSKKSGGTE